MTPQHQAVVNLRLTPHGFDLIVESVLSTIDAAKATVKDKDVNAKDRQTARAQVTLYTELLAAIGAEHRA
jgi:hypothetical protein